MSAISGQTSSNNNTGASPGVLRFVTRAEYLFRRYCCHYRLNLTAEYVAWVHKRFAERKKAEADWAQRHGPTGSPARVLWFPRHDLLSDAILNDGEPERSKR